MNNRDLKRQVAYEALVILGMLALLTFICRLWPILLLVILGILTATIRLVFLSVKKVESIEPLPLLPATKSDPTEQDLRTLAYSLIQKRITTMVLFEYPEARWVWEASNPLQRLERGESVYILLNRAGGYRRAKVMIQNLQVVGLQYVEESEITRDVPEELSDTKTYPPKDNYELMAFEWAESHIFDLNTRCNDAIGKGLTEIILSADELPVRESWPDVCRELTRADLEDVECIAEGIKIKLSH